MINQTNIKIVLTVLLFMVGGYYIQYSLSHGLIKANIQMSEVMADNAACTSGCK